MAARQAQRASSYDTQQPDFVFTALHKYKLYLSKSAQSDCILPSVGSCILMQNSRIGRYTENGETVEDSLCELILVIMASPGCQESSINTSDSTVVAKEMDDLRISAKLTTQ